MIPALVTPPTSPVVGLTDLRKHLKVTDDDDDLLITALERAAVAHLDGWSGILGRCIMPQTWEMRLDAGRHVLPFPDVTEATFDAGEDQAEIEITLTASGPQVELSESGTVRFTCSMPAHLLPAAQTAVKIWVAAIYDDKPVENSFNALVTSLRWWAA